MTGCASTSVRFQDYVSTVKRNADRAIDYDDNHNPQPVYISVADAQAAIDLLSDAYMDASRQDRNASTVTDVAVLTSAVATAFIALVDENPVEARKVGLGGILFSLIGERVNNPAYRQIYLEGAQALNCVHEASTRLPGVAGLKLLKLNLLLAKQANDIDRVKTTLNTYHAASDAIKPEDGRELIRSTYKGTIEDAKTQILRAEYMANSIETQLTLIDPRGRQLLNKARQIHIEVEKELVYNEYRSLSFNGALQKVFASGGGSSLLDFSSLKPVAESGEENKNGNGSGEPADSLMQELQKINGNGVGGQELPEEQQKVIDAHESIKAAVKRLKATNMEINGAITQLAKEPLSFAETAFDSCPFAPPTLRGVFRLDITEYKITLPAEGTAYKETVTIPILGGVSPYTPLKGGLPEEATEIKPMGNGYALVVTLDSTKVTLDSDKRISVRDSRNNESSLHIKVTKPSADPKLTLDSEQVKRVQEYLKGVLAQETTDALITQYKVRKFVDSKWGKATEEAIKAYLKMQENSVPTERQEIEKLKKHEFDGKVIYTGADGQYTPQQLLDFTDFLNPDVSQ